MARGRFNTFPFAFAFALAFTVTLAFAVGAVTAATPAARSAQ